MKIGDITIKLKERFCKDCNIPIKLFHDPYFGLRLALFNSYYDTIRQWETFVESLEPYNNEQEYFEEYNRVKDKAISRIKDSEAYQGFNEEDMNQFAVQKNSVPSKDIYKPSNAGRVFISIDMRKANFSALRHYDERMFMCDTEGLERVPAKTWEQFISQFTQNKHIIDSKYIRQVILGNCNPKRHITYERYLMEGVLNYVLERYFLPEEVVFLSNDELIVDVTSSVHNDEAGISMSEIESLEAELYNVLDLDMRVEMFTLHKIGGTEGYYKEIMTGEEEKPARIEFKCLDALRLPFVIRAMDGQKVRDADCMFYHEGLLAKFIDIPEIVVE